MKHSLILLVLIVVSNPFSLMAKSKDHYNFLETVDVNEVSPATKFLETSFKSSDNIYCLANNFIASNIVEVPHLQYDNENLYHWKVAFLKGHDPYNPSILLQFHLPLVAERKNKFTNPHYDKLPSLDEMLDFMEQRTLNYMCFVGTAPEMQQNIIGITLNSIVKESKMQEAFKQALRTNTVYRNR